jgi:hypothetical protein
MKARWRPVQIFLENGGVIRHQCAAMPAAKA